MDAIGFSPEDVIESGSALRLTVGEAYSLLPDSFFAQAFTTFYGKLTAVASVVPFTRNGVTPGANVAVVDVINHATRTGAEIMSALDGMSDNFTEVKSVQLLSAAEKSQANKPAGQDAREAARKDAARTAEADSAWHKFISGLGIAADTLKVVGIVAIIVLVVIYMPRTHGDD